MRKREIPAPYKYIVLGLLSGLSAGVGALVFDKLVDTSTKLFLENISRFNIKKPLEGPLIFGHERWYLILLVLVFGGILVGLIARFLTKEATGHGTDSIIKAYHAGEDIPIKVPLAKIVASAITLGTGGSAGKEGPMTQIGGGFSSFFARVFGFDEKDRKIALAAGLGAGVGAIFKVPIGGAILSAEILYKQDLETDVLYTSLVASATSFAIFGLFKGYQPIFMVPSFAFDPKLLPLFIIEGLLCGFLGVLFIKMFQSVDSFFKKLKVEEVLKPAIGGLIVGVLGIFFPHILGSGYERIQFLLLGVYESLNIPIPYWLLLFTLPFLKMLATSVTLGSGGSGGVFAPGMVIGGFIGAFLGYVFKTIMPGIVTSEVPFIVVGMTSFFGATGKISLSIIPMVIEMTANLHVVPYVMVSNVVATLITGTNTIYPSQKLRRGI